MEEPQNNTIRNQKQNCPSMTIKLTGGGGGGRGGIIFLGGTLIAATLVSAIAFRRGRNRRQQQEDHPPSSTDKESHHTPPPPTTTMIDLPSNLEMAMKSSKDHHHHHHQVINKGLSFLLPADSALPIVHKNQSSDAFSENGATQIESTQALILDDDEKSKLEINGEKVDTTKGDEDIVLSEIRKEPERTPLFDDSDLTVTGEEFSFPILDIPLVPSLEKVKESTNLEVALREVPMNSVGCDRETLFPSSSVLPIHEIMNESELLPEHPPLISMKAAESVEGDNEETNATPDDGNQVVVEEREEMYDTVMQEMVVEDAVQTGRDDRAVEEEEREKVYEDEEMIKNCDQENIGLAKEGETIRLECDHVIVGEDKTEMQLVGQKQQDITTMEVTIEQNRVESVSVDQIVEVELIGKEERDDSAENSNEKHEEEVPVEAADHANEDNQQMQLDKDKHTCGDDNGRAIRTEANTDQVAEENDKEVIMIGSREAIINCDEEGLQSDNMISILMPTEATETEYEEEDSIKAGSLDHTKGEEKADVKLIIEQEREECVREVITKKCEYASTETANADELGESLINYLQPENANENNNPEKDPVSAEADNLDEVSDIASVDQVSVEGTIPNQLTETVAIAEETVGKGWVEENPQMESSENEEADDCKDDYEDDDNNAEKGADSSEGTGDSSMESNSDAIWPAESALELVSEFNNEGLISTNLKTEEELTSPIPSEESGGVVNGCEDNVNEDEDEAATKQLKQLSMELWNLRTWTQSMFVSLWCFCHWYLGLPFLKASLIAIVLFLVVLSGFPSQVLAS